ncbi:hypothetical protein H5410_004468 [Solanum commersonii]|uniref:Uncharacterized protein n=1 Tax=Solanum commersonii TaxID=4109 RepID=A0A9J6B8H9_SOLCO|nr:hypothetical protein H5410_004468 [Solanum commersonii]
MITRNWKIPCELAEMMEEIHDMVGKIRVQVSHIFREENQLADYIENLAINKEEIKTFQNFIQLPSLGRRILNIDKQHILSARIKKKRINNNNNISYVGSNKVVKEPILFLSYESQQKGTEGPAKSESIEAKSDFKTSF